MKGGQGAREIAQERFPGANFTAKESPDKQFRSGLPQRAPFLFHSS